MEKNKVTDQIKDYSVISNGVEYVGVFTKTSKPTDGKYSAILHCGTVTSIRLSEYYDWVIISEHDSIISTIVAVQQLVEG